MIRLETLLQSSPPAIVVAAMAVVAVVVSPSIAWPMVVSDWTAVGSAAPIANQSDATTANSSEDGFRLDGNFKCSATSQLDRRHHSQSERGRRRQWFSPLLRVFLPHVPPFEKLLFPNRYRRLQLIDGVMGRLWPGTDQHRAICVKHKNGTSLQKRNL